MPQTAPSFGQHSLAPLLHHKMICVICSRKFEIRNIFLRYRVLEAIMGTEKGDLPDKSLTFAHMKLWINDVQELSRV